MPLLFSPTTQNHRAAEIAEAGPILRTPPRALRLCVIPFRNVPLSSGVAALAPTPEPKTNSDQTDKKHQRTEHRASRGLDAGNADAVLASRRRKAGYIADRRNTIFARIRKIKFHRPRAVHWNLFDCENNFLLLQMTDRQCQDSGSPTSGGRRFPAHLAELSDSGRLDFENRGTIAVGLRT